ncbi:hypothetical protein PRK78_002226 [Emydomyces testavorans]|uniref:Uncharacterized protein n=1 Tax=Emydomyces testavorans TaxID=2070801 RepID=A0AAF0IJG0_9EURO|nr:hypothetical protein PRK78_002226 [Emydomyces testavorans]
MNYIALSGVSSVVLAATAVSMIVIQLVDLQKKKLKEKRIEELERKVEQLEGELRGVRRESERVKQEVEEMRKGREGKGGESSSVGAGPSTSVVATGVQREISQGDGARRRPSREELKSLP